MRRLGILMIALTLASACDDDNNGNPAGPSNTGPLIFNSQLSAANEVPPVTNAESTGRGTVTITITAPRDTAGNPTGAGTATFAIQTTGFAPGTPAVAAHIHPGAAGVNGGFVVNTNLSAAAPLIMADGTANTTISNIAISQDLITQIMNNPAGFYFNVHTPTNPGGAVRGQLARVQ
jgi:CHRD domain